jgi:GNAT superfamily N-acetyltransferase
MENGIELRELTGFAAMRSMFPLIRQSNPELDEATFDSRLRRMLDAGGYRCVAAWRGAALVGVAGFWTGTALWCGTYVEPDNVVVDEAQRGSGIGGALLAWVEAEAERLGCEILKLETDAARRRTREFYRRAGYEEPGVVMIKTLSAGRRTIDAMRRKAAS